MKFTGYNFYLGDEPIHIEASILVIAAAAKNADPYARINLCGQCKSLCFDMKWCACCEAERLSVADTMFNSVGARGYERASRRPADHVTHRRLPQSEIDAALAELRAA